MVIELVGQLRTLLENQLVGGGLVLMVVGAAMALLRRLPAQVVANVWRLCTVTMEVRGHDRLYDWLIRWLAEQPYTLRARRVAATNLRNEDGSGVLVSLAPGRHRFVYKGRLLELSIDRRELQNATDFGRSTADSMTVSILGGTRRALRDLVEDAQQIAQRKELDERVTVWRARRGSWEHAWRFKPRRLETVILPGSTQQDIRQDIQRFLDDRPWYETRGLRWRRGYLLHGVPGSGKTSTIVSLAGAFGFDLCIVSLQASGMDDEVLATLFLEAPDRAVVVLEDVDALLDGRTLNATEGVPREGVTFSGLLNVLDGVAMKPGQMVWMTTNHVERLDPALIRPGRVDRIIEFSYASAEQVRSMFIHFFGDVAPAECLDAFATTIAAKGVTMAEVQQHLLVHREDPSAALQAHEVLDPGARPEGPNQTDQVGLRLAS